MKFQIMLSYALLASLLACCCLADNNSTVEPPMNETMSNTTTSESNMTIPILIIVEEANNMKTQYDTDADYYGRDVNWIVVKKITNITVTKESSVDPKTKKTKDVVTENRAEEYRVYQDGAKREVLTERNIKTMPFPFHFL